MENEFNKHEIIWTRDKVSHMWDYFRTNKSYEDTYYCKMVGDAVINYTNSKIQICGRVLDFGCGSGVFIEKLLSKSISCEGLDISKESVDMANINLSNNPLFKGSTLSESLPTPFKDDSFDIVFLLAIIEHLLPDELAQTIEEIHRITKKDGYIVLTTANEEDLNASKIICPDCGSIFHRVQHITSWDQTGLTRFMDDNGFKCIECSPITFRGNSKLDIIRGFVSNIIKAKKRDLVYIGKKEK